MPTLITSGTASAQAFGFGRKVAAGVVLDPNIANVSLLLHGEGADNGTVFTDSSPNVFTATRGGSTVTSATQKKFGAAALKLNGSTDFLSYADNPAFTFGAGDFTVEAWVYPTTAPGANRAIVGQTASNSVSWWFYFNASGLLVFVWSGSTTATASTGTYAANTWTHVAAVRDGGTLRLYKDGVQVGSQAVSGAQLDCTDIMRVGVVNGGTVASPSLTYYFPGYIDDLRVTKGVCRYTGGTTFTPPTAALPDVGPPPAAGTQTFDPSSTNANLTLSLSNSKAQVTSVGALGWLSTYMTGGPRASGKYYLEFFINKTHSTGGNYTKIGMAVARSFANGQQLSSGGNAWTISDAGNLEAAGSTVGAVASFATNDTVMLAFDLDNLKMYYGKNGTWLNNPSSGTPTMPLTSFASAYFGMSLDSSLDTYAATYNKTPTYTVPAGYTAWS